MSMSLRLRVLALVFVIAAGAVTAQTSDSSPEATCLGNCFTTVLSKTPSPQGCGKIATATDIENCVCTSNTFAEQVGECLGGTCPDIAQSIAQNVVSFCQTNTSGGSPSSDSGEEDSTSEAAGSEPTSEAAGAEPTSGGTSGSGNSGNSGSGNGGSSGNTGGLGILGGSGKGGAAVLKAPVLGLAVMTGLSLFAMC